MLELFQKLFIGHVHKWNTIDERIVFEYADDKIPIATKYICRCEHCGKIKCYVV